MLATMPEILVVEDDLELADAVSDVLGMFGFDCHRARSLAEARAAADSVDLVLLDLGLADGDGMELCRQLQGRVPVIVMTARGSSADRVSSLEGGADDYVAKPFDARELVAAVSGGITADDGIDPGSGCPGGRKAHGLAEPRAGGVGRHGAPVDDQGA